MEVKTLCLGLLTFGDASGYDLKKRFEESFGFFYSAGYGSIYPALAQLAETDLVTCEAVSRDGRPDRKVYRITAPGRQQFAQALENACPEHKMRSEFLAMIFFAHLMEPEQIDRVLDHRIEEMQALLTELERMRQSGACPHPSGVEFVCGFGETLAQAALKYMQDQRHLLAQAQAAPVMSATAS